MDKLRVIELKESIFRDNNRDADRLRAELNERKSFLINLMSAPGSGKTTTLTKIIEHFRGKYTIRVIEADIDGDVDGKTIKELGAPCVQVHTGGMCHLDADMTRQGIRELPRADIIFLENIGNLVCPAEYDTGAHCKMMILSVTEGDDKPLKYPLMFSVAEAVLINKTDALPYFDFDIGKCSEYIHQKNRDAEIMPVCAQSGDGMDAVYDWVEKKYLAWKETL